MDSSKTDSLRVPQDSSEEQSDLKTTKWEGKIKTYCQEDIYSLHEFGWGQDFLQKKAEIQVCSSRVNEEKTFQVDEDDWKWDCLKSVRVKENREILLNIFICSKEICCNNYGGKVQLLLLVRLSRAPVKAWVLLFTGISLFRGKKSARKHHLLPHKHVGWNRDADRVLHIQLCSRAVKSSRVYALAGFVFFKCFLQKTPHTAAQAMHVEYGS